MKTPARIPTGLVAALWMFLGMTSKMVMGLCPGDMLDQSATAVNNAHTVNQGIDVAQTFTAGVPGLLTHVDVQVSWDEWGNGNVDDLIVDIVTTDGAGAPTATSLATAYVEKGAVPQAGSVPPLTCVPIPGGVVLEAGTKYAIRLTSPGTSSSPGYQWLFSAQSGSGGGSDPDYYTAGQMYRDNGSGLQAYPGDAVFKTYMVTVTISGTAAEDQVLTMSNDLTDLDGVGEISYQWKRGGVAIDGATQASYTLLQADVGSQITVTASYTDGEGTAKSVTSAATTAVANVNDAPAGTVAISGTATEGHFLTVSNDLADEDGLGEISYQWNRSGNTIPGTTSSTYALTQDDAGSTITVTASYIDGEGTPESVTSAATATVALDTDDDGLGDDVDPDDDGDGVSDILEARFNGDPLDPSDGDNIAASIINDMDELQAQVSELSQRPTLQQVRDGRPGSVLLSVDSDAGTVALGFTVEESEDLITWTPVEGPGVSQTLTLPEGKRFYRFAH